MAAMGSLGEFPDRVKKIFRNIEGYPDNGQFELDFWYMGKFMRVTIDDRLPGNQRGTSWWPQFARKSRNGAWWGPILEKASAKWYGYYRRMWGGNPFRIFYSWTGMPIFHVRHKDWDQNKIWEKLVELDKKKYMMTTGWYGIGKEVGLVSAHSYSLLGAYEYKGTRLIKVRNPWGSERYRGVWSDKDTSKWTPEAKKALNHENANDGSFFIPLD